MMLDEVLKRVAVLGAAGKMGCGISLLLLEEMALLEAKNTGKVGMGEYRLDLIDANFKALNGLQIYLFTHLTQMAEKKINLLRQFFSSAQHLVSNEDIIRTFVEGAMRIIHPATEVEEAKGAVLILEAVVEDVQVKSALFHRLAQVNPDPFYVLSNTSSIPIHELDNKGRLEGRVIGFHFYNPPPVQRLLELIPLEGGNPLLHEWAQELAARLKKKIVVSKDVAGFIGNGFLIRELLFACAKVREFMAHNSTHQALYMVNKVSQDFLLRPMGCFQLVDFIGLDVAFKIGLVMNQYLSEGPYTDALIEELISQQVLGGQFSDGSQKNGIFQYEKHQLIGVYSPDEKRYVPFTEGAWKADADKALGELAVKYTPWKVLHKDAGAMAKIRHHFQVLISSTGLGAELARGFLKRDNEIVHQLVDSGVATCKEDVKTVLQNGFYHLYGPEDVLLPEEKRCQ